MLTVLVLLQILAVAGGALLIYGSLFLYETEERQIQNTLEVWWIRINDLHNAAIGRHTALIKGAANLAGASLDHIFGKRLVSLRAISVSGLLSLASFHLAATYLSNWTSTIMTIDPTQANTPADRVLLAIVAVYAAIGRLLLLVAVPTRPLFMHAVSMISLMVVAAAASSKQLARLAQLVLLLFSIFFVTLAFFARPYPDFVGLPFVVLVAVGAGIICDVVAITVARLLIRWQATWRSFVNIAFGAALELTMGGLLLFAPIYVGVRLMSAGVRAHALYGSMIGWAIMLSTLTNVASVLVSFSFFGALLTLAMHRLAWPLIERPLYQVARLGVFRNITTKTAVFLLGMSLITVGTGQGDDVFSYVIRLFQSG